MSSSMSGVWNGATVVTIEAPPDERGGNRYALPNAGTHLVVWSFRLPWLLYGAHCLSH